ncbi:MAG: PQQ-dependent dehydrogenase, methanol/ethanol family, partial [Bradyrhizobium sp.]|nr:PQQ-dependent dehydrogenase, methanol/ethanol family [Bradyrhizobium sp.]
QSADQLVKGATDTANVLNYGMGYNLQRFSPLTQINKDNAKNLVPVWNYSFADDRSEESQPLVYQGVLYVTTHNATMAVDAKTGKQIWKSKIDYPAETPRVVCCGIINRGAALFDGKVFRTTLDANVIALDAKTGKELWRQKAADIKEGYSMTVAPLVADGVVITGISGAEFGTRGFIDGWDPATGKHLWRTHTVPTPDEPGGDTWKGDTWKLGGGSTWITGSYDPEQNTVFWGVGNPGPFNAAVRPGDNLYTCSVLALDPKTGKMKWHFQFSPNNPFDYDAVAEMVLADMNVEGKPTKVLMNANRNGFFYVLDRSNGKLLAANPYVKVNWASSIDLKTGKPVET